MVRLIDDLWDSNSGRGDVDMGVKFHVVKSSVCSSLIVMKIPSCASQEGPNSCSSSCFISNFLLSESNITSRAITNLELILGVVVGSRATKLPGEWPGSAGTELWEVPR